jgi:hypothetical protein
VKPNLKPADHQAYENAKAIPEGTPITLDGKSGVMLSPTGHMLTMKIGRKIEHMRAGDPRLERIVSGYANTNVTP